MEEAICCKKFTPENWDNKFFEWKDKNFIEESVKTLFYMPVGYGKVMNNMFNLIDSVDGSNPDDLCLSDYSSGSKMRLLVATDGEIPGANNITMSGNFYSKVYEGKFSDTGKWLKNFSNFLKSKGLNPKNEYMWYTTCPKCAKVYGKNYVVIIAEI